MANSVDPEQSVLGPCCLHLYLNSPVMLDNYLQQTTSADDIVRCIFFLGALGLMYRNVILKVSTKTLYMESLNENPLYGKFERKPFILNDEHTSR